MEKFETNHSIIEKILYFFTSKDAVSQGETFFQAIAKQIGETLGVDYVFIDKKIDDHKVRTVALYAKGQIRDNIEYLLESTPCEGVFKGDYCIYPDGIQKLYPQDLMLVDMEAQGYAGLPLKNSRDETIGLIAIVTRRPIADRDLIKSILQIVSLQVAAEMERSQIYEELRNNEERFRSAFEHSRVGMNILDSELKYTHVNDAFCQITGYTREELINKNFKVMTHPDDLEKNMKLADSLLAGKIDCYHMEKRYYHKSGKIIWVDLTVSAVRNIDGKLQSIVALVQNITGHKELEASLEEKNVQLESLNEELEERVLTATQRALENEKIAARQAHMAAMGEMIGAIAHQWRQPLNALALTVQDILEAKESGELDTKYLKKSISQSMDYIRHMSQTIDDFRAFLRPDLTTKEFKLDEAIMDAIKISNPQMVNHNIEIKLENFTLLSQNSIILGNPNEFKQVVLNLLNNSKDAIEEFRLKNKEAGYQGVIYIRVVRSNPIIIHFDDNGGGISHEALTQLFNPYYTTKKEGHGTGIGLFFSKQIIEEKMSGWLFAENIENGARFKIILNTI